MNDLFGFVKCKCAGCGVEFERLSKDWAYRIRDGSVMRYYHSFSCWTKAQEGRTFRNRKVTKRLSEEEKAKLYELLDAGYKPGIIAKMINRDEQLVDYYKKKRT